MCLVDVQTRDFARVPSPNSLDELAIEEAVHNARLDPSGDDLADLRFPDDVLLMRERDVAWLGPV